jgi:hypothetical protein
MRLGKPVRFRRSRSKGESDLLPFHSMSTEQSAVTATPEGPAIQFVPTGADLSGFGELMGFHRHLMSDRIRTEAFLRAVEQTVKPGDVVVDLGTGTGVLAMAACRAGAAKVYAIEYGSIVDVARDLAHHNQFSERIEFVADDSRNFRAPQHVDVLVSECLGFMGLGGTMIGAVSDLAGRCIRDRGTVIPREISAFLAPVESRLHFEYVNCWATRYGFDFSRAQRLASNNLYVAKFLEAAWVSAPQKAGGIHFLRDRQTSQFHAALRFVTRRPCWLHGFCGWFETDLCDGVVLSTSPVNPTLVWQQVYLPLEREIELVVGGTIDVDFSITYKAGALPVVFSWNTNVSDARGAAFHMEQSTSRSFPQSPTES